MIRQRWAPERVVKILSPHKTQFSVITRPLKLNSQQCVSQDFSICFCPRWFKSLLCALAARTFLALCDWCGAIAVRIGTAVLGKESRCVSIPHSCTAHITHSVVLWLQEWLIEYAAQTLLFWRISGSDGLTAIQRMREDPPRCRGPDSENESCTRYGKSSSSASQKPDGHMKCGLDPLKRQTNT